MAISRMLLVHGAWCWDRVLGLLRSSGYRAEAMDLPGHGDSSAPFGDLHRNADAVASRLDVIGEPTLLVGHSYGGMVITDAGSHEAVAALVYSVCAFMPTAGQSLMDALRGQRRPEGAAESDLLGCVRLTDDESAMYLEGDGVVSALYGDCEPPCSSGRSNDWVSSRQRRLRKYLVISLGHPSRRRTSCAPRTAPSRHGTSGRWQGTPVAWPS